MDDTNVIQEKEANVKELETSIKATMFISSAMAGLGLLKKDEPYEHTKRYREVSKVEKALWDLFNLYNPKDLDQYDIVKIGEWFHLKMEEELTEFLESKGYLKYRMEK